MRVVNVLKPTMFTGLDYASVLEVAGDGVADTEARGHMWVVSLVAVSHEA